MIETNDTIAALATGPGEYGIAIIRISGPQSLPALETLIRRSHAGRNWRPRTLHHGYATAADGERLDEVMAVYLPGPATVTGEDCAEIHCHGGRVIIRRILDSLVAAGLRLATPGEFTRRAFLNGRIDLSRAEAVADLIHARSDASRRIAFAQLEGSLQRRISALRDEAADLLALIEAYLDFPDDEVGAFDSARIAAGSAHLDGELSRLIDGYEQGRILRDGASLLIIGRPNVGKSSLLNVLVGEERAIVSNQPGTTRDTVEESILLEGLPFRIIDTAGIRDSDDTVEAIGVQRALAKLESADLVLLVYDAAVGFTTADSEVLERCRQRPVLLVANKSDLPAAAAHPPVDLPRIALSCRLGFGIDALPAMIRACLDPEGDFATRALVSDLRHKEALVRARAALVSFSQLIDNGAPAELAALEMRALLAALGEITGETAPDEILDRIFSRFCIGK